MNPFFCIDCAETHETAPIQVGPYQVCESGFRDRIVPQFEQALKNEAEHPVKVDNVPLDINNYTAFFSSDFLSKWRKKQLEYTTPIQRRLYCGCGEFLGRKGRLGDVLVFFHCPSCRAIACSSCGKVVPEGGLHPCTSSELIEDAFANMKRGDDYQICPNETCKIKVTLADGCNHMTCPFCRTDFCFICGNKAKDRSGHWNVGNSCPRFGKKGSARAIFDQQPAAPNYFRFMAGERRRLSVDGNRGLDAIIRDPARAEQIRAEEEQIMATPRGRLYSDDFGILEEIHSEIIDEETYHYQGTPTPEELHIAHSLVHRLEMEMEVYITDMRVHGAPATPFRDDQFHRTANERIRTHVDRLGAVVDRYEGLRNIILSYTEAWEGRTDQLWAVRQG